MNEFCQIVVKRNEFFKLLVLFFRDDEELEDLDERNLKRSQQVTVIKGYLQN